jgi:hypothetical protein
MKLIRKVQKSYTKLSVINSRQKVVESLDRNVSSRRNRERAGERKKERRKRATRSV